MGEELLHLPSGNCSVWWQKGHSRLHRPYMLVTQTGPGTAALASPGSMLEMQNLRLHRRPTTPGLHFNNLPRDLYMHYTWGKYQGWYSEVRSLKTLGPLKAFCDPAENPLAHPSQGFQSLSCSTIFPGHNQTKSPLRHQCTNCGNQIFL